MCFLFLYTLEDIGTEVIIVFIYWLFLLYSIVSRIINLALLFDFANILILLVRNCLILSIHCSLPFLLTSNMFYIVSVQLILALTIWCLTFWLYYQCTIHSVIFGYSLYKVLENEVNNTKNT